MVATSHPLAAQAGLDILKKGGNAVDAAIAAAAALTVVEPTSNGLGGDAFAIIRKDGKLHGINGSGPSPAAFSLEKLKSAGMEKIPMYGWQAVDVPGVPAAWAELSRKMGRLPLSESLAPAVSLAREGFAAAVTVADAFGRAFAKHAKLSGPEFAPWLETFCPGGRPPRAGELCKLPWHAQTLEQIASTDARSFYEGEVARKILSFAKKTGGFFSGEDLASFRPEWVEPVAVNYRGYDVWELPPNGQGIVALIALNILKEFDIRGHGDLMTLHRQIEAIKISFAEARRCIADPSHSPAPLEEILSDDFAANRRARISDFAQAYSGDDPYSGGTVYLCAADGEGCMISYIQSNYTGFGSFVVVPETGIALNNRGSCFSLDPEHPNALAPRKRPYNTIIPGFLTKGGKPIGPFGVMGGYMQPQGHVQVVMNAVNFGMNPQEALDAPRWQWTGGTQVKVEPGFPPEAARGLRRMGHAVSVSLDSFEFGRGEIIWRNEEGTLTGATEGRADGCAAAW